MQSAGFKKQGYEFHNVYDCGYYKISNQLIDYQTLDYGFDFVTAQTFYNADRNMPDCLDWMPDNAYIDR